MGEGGGGVGEGAGVGNLMEGPNAPNKVAPQADVEEHIQNVIGVPPCSHAEGG